MEKKFNSTKLITYFEARAPWQDIKKEHRKKNEIPFVDLDNPCGMPCLECTMNEIDCIVNTHDIIGKFRKIPNEQQNPLHNRKR